MGDDVTPAGWYPDPSTTGLLRWWDGTNWTPHIAKILANGETANETAAFEKDISSLRGELEMLKAQIVHTSSVQQLQEVGIYEYSHPLDDVPAYKAKLDEIEGEFRQLTKDNGAVSTTQKWAINGSEKDGAKMVSDLGKLMLRTYNTEVDNVVRTLKPYAVDAAIARLDKMRASIAKLGASMKLAITERYHGLRCKEVRLTADFLAKQADERERQREAREQMKEDEKARKERDAEKARIEAQLEKERQQYQRVLDQLEARGDLDAIAEHRKRLTDLEDALDGVLKLSANLRAGWVYVISNVGAFGERVLKIGLTRRMDPHERIRELHNASVPFRFDVHAVVFSEDAVALETALHQTFAAERLNLANPHKEFFRLTPAQVKTKLLDLQGELLEFKDTPEALEWRQSEAERAKRKVAV